MSTKSKISFNFIAYRILGTFKSAELQFTALFDSSSFEDRWPVTTFKAKVMVKDCLVKFKTSHLRFTLLGPLLLISLDQEMSD